MPDKYFTIISKGKLVALLILYFFFLLLLCFLYSRKTQIFIDEPASFQIAFKNYHRYPNLKVDNESVRNFKSFFWGVAPASIKSALKNNYAIRKDNLDTPHTNLYYSLINFATIGAGESFDKWMVRGFLLNLILFSIAFFMLFLLTGEFTNNFAYRIVIIFSSFISAASLSNCLFIREYQLQETAFICIVYLFIKVYNYLSSQNLSLPPPPPTHTHIHCGSAPRLPERFCSPIQSNDIIGKTFLGAFTVAIGYLSGYFGLLFIGLLFLGLAFYAIKTKNFFFLITLLYIFLLALIISYAVYPDFLKGVGVARGDEALKKISFNYFLNSFYPVTGVFINLLLKYFFSLPGVVVLISSIGLAAMVKKETCVKNSLSFIIFIFCLIWCYLVLFLAPYKEIRYIFSISPLLIAMSFFLLPPKLYAYIFLACGVCLTNSNGLAYFVGNDKILDNKNIVLIYKSDWKLRTLMPFLPDDATITIYTPGRIKELTSEKLKKFDAIIMEDSINQNDYFETETLKNQDRVGGCWNRYMPD